MKTSNLPLSRLFLTVLTAILLRSAANASQVPPVYNLSDLGLSDGDYLEIPANTTVMVDTELNNTPDLGGVWVSGKLIFYPTTSKPHVELRTQWMIVGESSTSYACEVQMGTGSSPIPEGKSATLTLISGVTALDPEDPDDDSGTPSPYSSLGVEAPFSATFNDLLRYGGVVVWERGKFFAFGHDLDSTWTELVSTAGASATSVTVLESAGALEDWVGQEIVIASTDFDSNQAQVVTVNSVAVNTGNSNFADLNLSAGLTYSHYGIDYKPDSSLSSDWILHEKAEVGLLSRNVLIRAETWNGTDWVEGSGAHGHVILCRDAGGTKPVGRFSWARFKNLGVEGAPMRYPLHYHLTGDFTGASGSNLSMVKNCSFTYCFNKFVAVHDTQSIEVSGNVGFDTIGNGFYLEDAAATGITLANNLGLGVRAAEQNNSPADRDLEPAVFWYVSADNKISGNRAAGSSHYGFWYSPEANDPFTVDGTNSYFRDNVAHSNGHHGFYQDKVATDTGSPRAKPWYTSVYQMEDCTFYKNRRYGVWVRSYGRVLFDNLRVADNRSGYYFASDGFQQVIDGPSSSKRTLSHITLSNSLAIDETSNLGYENSSLGHENEANRSLPQSAINWDGDRQHDLDWATLTGIDFYDGLVELDTVRFGDFTARYDLNHPTGSGYADRLAAAMSQVAYDSQFMVDPRNRVQNLEFYNVDSGVVFRYPSAAVPGANMIKNTIIYDVDGSAMGLGEGYLLPLDEPLLTYGVTSVPFTTERVLFVPVENADYASLVVETSGSTGMVWARMTHSYPSSGGSQDVKQANNQDKHPLAVIMNREYALDYLDSTLVSLSQGSRPTVLDLKLRFAEREDQWIVIAVPWHSGTKPGTRTVNTVNMTEKSSLTDLRDAGNLLNSFFWDNSTSTIYVKIFTDLISGSVDLISTGTEQICHIQ